MKQLILFPLLSLVLYSCTSSNPSDTEVSENDTTASSSFRPISSSEYEYLTNQGYDIYEDDQISYDEESENLSVLHSDGSLSTFYFAGGNGTVINSNGDVDFVYDNGGGNGTVIHSNGDVDFLYDNGGGNGTIIRSNGDVDFVYGNGNGNGTIIRSNGDVDFVYSNGSGGATIIRSDGGVDFVY